MAYVDLHCHLLPGVDDGAPSLVDSLVYARRLAAEGVQELTCTPHVNGIWPLDPRSIVRRVDQVQTAIDREALGVRLHAGGELAHRRV